MILTMSRMVTLGATVGTSATLAHGLALPAGSLLHLSAELLPVRGKAALLPCHR